MPAPGIEPEAAERLRIWSGDVGVCDCCVVRFSGCVINNYSAEMYKNLEKTVFKEKLGVKE